MTADVGAYLSACLALRSSDSLSYLASSAMYLSQYTSSTFTMHTLISHKISYIELMLRIMHHFWILQNKIKPFSVNK